ncbi:MULTISPECIES: helix-turn-helix transcriptional regulator [unclassified Adlercreutzia]|uniref:helix-turn-helix transcriptional regulator n=1 Tax=unclassified Adlercreutzia TaxID=2636013 RepID=UPI0013E9D5D9|nr:MULTISPECIES: LuxR C-terminal-related transcriptional regulator [unclassified Adlercreutzia]
MQAKHPKESDQKPVSPVELLGIAGFSLAIGWMIITGFWLFCSSDGLSALPDRSLIHLTLFVGYPAGFVLLHILGKRTTFTPFLPIVLVVEAVTAVILPALCIVASFQIEIAPLLFHIASFFAGCSAACYTLSWLDICSRLHTKMYGRFTGMSFFWGCVAFVIAVSAESVPTPWFACIYALVSIGAIRYTTIAAEGNDTRPPLSSLRRGFHFSKEIESSFFLFGITFGMTFAYFFVVGRDAVFVGLCCIIPGALCIALLSMLRIKVSVTVMMRVCLCVCVFSCVFMPYSSGLGRLVCSCLIVAVSVIFTALNYAFLIRKCVIMHNAPCFKEIALRLAVPAAGFAVGWLVICIATFFFGEGADEFIPIRLFFAVLLVTVFAFFFPNQEHHSMDSTASSTSGLDEKESFDLKIQGIASTYGLSRREVEVTRFLAQGRNAAYIQERLVISPHTVRSHMYNIYKKLEVHSQNEMISVIERFAIDEDDRT